MTRSGISLVIAALLLQGSAARAAQLDKDSCAKLKTEQAQLEQGGARGSMGKGPEWAKVNLAPDKLEQIRRLIELDEQLLFRCGGRPLVIIPHDPDPAAREVENKEGAAKGPPAKAAKAPDAEKKQAVPLKKAAAPPNQPAKGAAKETPPVKTAPQPEAASAPAKEGEDKKAALPPVGQSAKEAATETPPARTTPQPDAASSPAKEGEDKKSSVLPADQPPVKEAAKETPPAKAAPQPQAGPAPSKEAEDKKAAAAKAAKAKAKKKTNDAYSSPFADWNINPFAAQAGPPGKK
jgi:hypothetical protein